MLKRFLVIALAVIFTAACQGTRSNNVKHEVSYSDVVPAQQSELESKIGDRVFFDFNSSSLTAEAKNTLTRQAEWLKINPAIAVTIDGNTDDRGTLEYNLALGMRRAQVVKDYLVAQGIDDDRIFTVSHGKEKPAVLGTGEEVWSKNRRAETIVTDRMQ